MKDASNENLSFLGTPLMHGISQCEEKLLYHVTTGSSLAVAKREGQSVTRIRNHTQPWGTTRDQLPSPPGCSWTTSRGLPRVIERRVKPHVANRTI